LNVKLPPVVEKFFDLEQRAMSGRIYSQHVAEHGDSDLKADARQKSDQDHA
jgi:hypothetical protein